MRADPHLAEVLGLDAERLAECGDHVVGRHRAVAVDEVIEVAGRQSRLVGERAIGDVPLVHQPLDRRPERLLAEAASARHQRSSTLTRRSSPVARSRTSTAPSSRLFLPAVTRTGQPIRSASANFSPARWSRSSSRTLRPRASIAAAARSAISSPPGSATTWTSYGAIVSGHDDAPLVVALLDRAPPAPARGRSRSCRRGAASRARPRRGRLRPSGAE